MDSKAAPPAEIRIREGQPTSLANTVCVYCGKKLSRRSGTREHVIGRRFVPQGTLEKNWNLILLACRKCNEMKSDLEDDISAITMSFHTAGLHGMDDDLLKKEAQRKARRSVSRKTNKPVAASAESISLTVPFGSGATLTGNFTCPPQLDDRRAAELARLQLMGFFFLITYDTTLNRGWWWPHAFFHPVHGAIKPDWGNPIHRAFMAEIATWDHRLILHAANGYYRAVIRKHPTGDCWAWAVEWNDSYRLIGFFGNREMAIAMGEKMPALPVRSILEAERHWVRIREETPLPDNEDILFRMPDEDD